MVKQYDPRDPSKIIPYKELQKQDDTFDYAVLLSIGCLYATMMGFRQFIHIFGLLGISMFLTANCGMADTIKYIPLFISLLVYLVMPYAQEYFKRE